MEEQVSVFPEDYPEKKRKKIILRGKVSGDSFFKSFLGIMTILIFIIMGLLILTLVLRSLLSIETYGFGFLWGTKWNPRP